MVAFRVNERTRGCKARTYQAAHSARALEGGQAGEGRGETSDSTTSGRPRAQLTSLHESCPPTLVVSFAIRSSELQVVQNLHRCEKALEALGEEETKLLLVARSQQRKLEAAAAASIPARASTPCVSGASSHRPGGGDLKREQRGREQRTSKQTSTSGPKAAMERSALLRSQLEQAARALQAPRPLLPAHPPHPPHPPHFTRVRTRARTTRRVITVLRCS